MGGLSFSNHILTLYGIRMCYTINMPHVKRNTGIYCFENKLNGKKYIGQAYNVERRIYEHQYHLARGTDHSGVLQRAANKYGLENFEAYVLEACQPEQMNEREIFWIEYYQTNNPNFGYNLSRGGEKSLLGYKFPPEFGRKISMAKKGVPLSEETKRKISAAQKGKPKSEETKRRISVGLSGENHYLYGKTITEEHRENLRKAHGGKNAYQFGKKSPRASSQYFGVHRNILRGVLYWIADIKVHGVQKYLGAFRDEVEAAKKYDAYVIENNLPNPLNFPEE